MTPEEQILRHARGIGLTFLGEPPPLVTDDVEPFTYKARDESAAETDDDE